MNRSPILKNFTWLLGGNVFRSVVGLLVYLLIARHLGPADYGILQFCIAIHFILLSLESIVHSDVIQNAQVNHPKDWNEINGTVFTILLISSLIIFTSVTSLHYWKTENTELTILFIFSCTLPLRSINAISYWYTSQLKASRTVLAQSIGLIFSYSLSILFCFLHKNIYYFAFSYASQYLIGFLAHLCFYKIDKQSVINWRFNSRLAKRFLIVSFPFLFATTLFYLQSRINMFFIQGLLTNKDLGIYATANQLSEPWKYIPAAIVSSLLPMLIDRIKKGNDLFLAKVFSIQLLISLTICIGTFLFADIIIKSLLTVKYIQSVPILKVLIWSNIFNFWFITQQAIDVERGAQRFMTWRFLFGLPIALTTSYFFTRHFGVIGAAYSSLTVAFYYGFASNLMFKETREILRIQMSSIAIWRHLDKSFIINLLRREII